jgi:hypothetical protein
VVQNIVNPKCFAILGIVQWLDFDVNIDIKILNKNKRGIPASEMFNFYEKSFYFG